MIDPAQYYQHPAFSNSDLSAIEEYFLGREEIGDRKAAYRFGTLIDLMITEPLKIDYYKLTAAGVPYTHEEFEMAKIMKRSFLADPLCLDICKHAEFQRIFLTTPVLDYEGFEFSLTMRCKFDLFMPSLGWGGDIKSTTATTQKQFVDACYHFNYDRQRAVYMTLAGSNQDVLIGISKVNANVFKLPIKRGDEFFESGMKKFRQAAFKCWSLFSDITVDHHAAIH